MSVHVVMMLIPSMFIDLVNYYDLTKASLGLIFSISSFCFGLGSLPMSLLYNKYGPRKLLVFSQLGIFVSAFLVSSSQSVESFAIFNIFLGLFASIHHPVSLTLKSEVFDKNISKANAFVAPISVAVKTAVDATSISGVAVATITMSISFGSIFDFLIKSRFDLI